MDEKNLVVHPDDFLNSPPPVDEKKISAETSTQNLIHSDSEKLTDAEKEMLQQFRAKQLANKNSFDSQKPITDFQNMSAQEKEDLIPTGLPDEIVQKYKKTFNGVNA